MPMIIQPGGAAPQSQVTVTVPTPLPLHPTPVPAQAAPQPQQQQAPPQQPPPPPQGAYQPKRPVGDDDEESHEAVIIPHSGVGLFNSPHRPQKMSREEEMERYARRPDQMFYSQMADYLGNRPQRRMGANKVLRRVGGDIHLLLHNSPVVIAHPDGNFTVNTHGHNTPTTHRTIKFSPANTGVRKGNPVIWHPEMGDQPFEGPVTVDSRGKPITLDPRHLTSDVVGVARGIKQSGDYDRLPVLGDALQDAGVDDPAIIEHTRRPNHGSSWLVDKIVAESPRHMSRAGSASRYARPTLFFLPDPRVGEIASHPDRYARVGGLEKVADGHYVLKPEGSRKRFIITRNVMRNGKRVWHAHEQTGKTADQYGHPFASGGSLADMVKECSPAVKEKAKYARCVIHYLPVERVVRYASPTWVGSGQEPIGPGLPDAVRRDLIERANRMFENARSVSAGSHPEYVHMLTPESAGAQVSPRIVSTVSVVHRSPSNKNIKSERLNPTYTHTNGPYASQTVRHPGEVFSVANRTGMINANYHDAMHRIAAERGTVHNPGVGWGQTSVDDSGTITPLYHHPANPSKRDYLQVIYDKASNQRHYDKNGKELNFERDVAPFLSSRGDRELDVGPRTFKPNTIAMIKDRGHLLLKHPSLHGLAKSGNEMGGAAGPGPNVEDKAFEALRDAPPIEAGPAWSDVTTAPTPPPKKTIKPSTGVTPAGTDPVARVDPFEQEVESKRVHKPRTPRESTTSSSGDPTVMDSPSQGRLGQILSDMAAKRKGKQGAARARSLANPPVTPQQTQEHRPDWYEPAAGKGSVAPADHPSRGVHPLLNGSRLHANLRGLQRLGDPYLSRTIDQALALKDSRDPVTGAVADPFKTIKNRLSTLIERTTDPKGKAELRAWRDGYDWDKIGNRLRGDKGVHEALTDVLGGTKDRQALRFIREVVPGIREVPREGSGKTFRVPKDFVEQMSTERGADGNLSQREKWEVLRNRVRSRTAPQRGVDKNDPRSQSVLDEQILKSLFRNAVLERNKRRGQAPSGLPKSKRDVESYRRRYAEAVGEGRHMRPHAVDERPASERPTTPTHVSKESVTPPEPEAKKANTDAWTELLRKWRETHPTITGEVDKKSREALDMLRKSRRPRHPSVTHNPTARIRGHFKQKSKLSATKSDKMPSGRPPAGPVLRAPAGGMVVRTGAKLPGAYPGGMFVEGGKFAPKVS